MLIALWLKTGVYCNFSQAFTALYCQNLNYVTVLHYLFGFPCLLSFFHSAMFCNEMIIINIGLSENTLITLYCLLEREKKTSKSKVQTAQSVGYQSYKMIFFFIARQIYQIFHR